ncbi:MAG: class I SAM-dependent methyltransferase [Actinomycetota bacterium]
MTLGKSQPFDYRRIPVAYYDAALREGNSVRRLWHLAKFERVLGCLPHGQNLSLLDIGCFAGSFLSLVPEERFARQVGVDILPEQIAFAEAHWATSFREFREISTLRDLRAMPESFDCATAIEVIEHLRLDEIRELLDGVVDRLRPGGTFVLTTPNYRSAWPLIERVVNRASDISYADQHITKLTYRSIERDLVSIYPSLFRYFSPNLVKSTTHLVTPFLAALSFERALQLSRWVAQRHWKLPLGNLVLLVLRRNGESRC